MKAVVMAGGEGSRLRPLTSRQPKPLVPVAGRPIMEHILLHLRRHQMRDVIATVQYLGASIRNYFGDGSEQGVALTYSVEDSPLGTAARVRSPARTGPRRHGPGGGPTGRHRGLGDARPPAVERAVPRHLR